MNIRASVITFMMQPTALQARAKGIVVAGSGDGGMSTHPRIKQRKRAKGRYRSLFLCGRRYGQ
ncbi:hypothetical protein [Ammoniphilus sp. YIM 78166]|uniref:hypothetical protein n=1 Tax=Ammoniphilus sp. YIM 78166 TaxID=1644106 RepID=UPI0014310866|nr:hypothetical protein [Ammoniphilus sp. YIM 78166]